MEFEALPEARVLSELLILPAYRVIHELRMKDFDHIHQCNVIFGIFDPLSSDILCSGLENKRVKGWLCVDESAETYEMSSLQFIHKSVGSLLTVLKGREHQVKASVGIMFEMKVRDIMGPELRATI